MEIFVPRHGGTNAVSRREKGAGATEAMGRGMLNATRPPFRRLQRTRPLRLSPLPSNNTPRRASLFLTVWLARRVQRTLLKSKIHRATVTDADLNYEGSISIDEVLLEAADILANEQVAIVNVNNGARFETYAIKAPRGSGTIQLNGAAARLVQPGDIVIILSYAGYSDAETTHHLPRIVKVDAKNRLLRRPARTSGRSIPATSSAALLGQRS